MKIIIDEIESNMTGKKYLNSNKLFTLKYIDCSKE